MKRKICLAALLIFLPRLSQSAGDAPLDRATLRGLAAVNLVVDLIDPELQKLGITQDAVAPRLEERLKAAHINIDKSAAEFIAFRITFVHPNRGPYALSVTVGVYQPVILSRDRNLRTSTQTWEVESVVMGDSKVLKNACFETVDDLVDRFVKAYQEVNPQH
jgi:hypothetical protein